MSYSGCFISVRLGHSRYLDVLIYLLLKTTPSSGFLIRRFLTASESQQRQKGVTALILTASGTLVLLIPDSAGILIGVRNDEIVGNA